MLLLLPTEALRAARCSHSRLGCCERGGHCRAMRWRRPRRAERSCSRVSRCCRGAESLGGASCGIRVQWSARVRVLRRGAGQTDVRQMQERVQMNQGSTRCPPLSHDASGAALLHGPPAADIKSIEFALLCLLQPDVRLAFAARHQIARMDCLQAMGGCPALSSTAAARRQPYSTRCIHQICSTGMVSDAATRRY